MGGVWAYAYITWKLDRITPREGIFQYRTCSLLRIHKYIIAMSHTHLPLSPYLRRRSTYFIFSSNLNPFLLPWFILSFELILIACVVDHTQLCIFLREFEWAPRWWSHRTLSKLSLDSHRSYFKGVTQSHCWSNLLT